MLAHLFEFLAALAVPSDYARWWLLFSIGPQVVLAATTLR